MELLFGKYSFFDRIICSDADGTLNDSPMAKFIQILHDGNFRTMLDDSGAIESMRRKGYRWENEVYYKRIRNNSSNVRFLGTISVI